MTDAEIIDRLTMRLDSLANSESTQAIAEPYCTDEPCQFFSNGSGCFWLACDRRAATRTTMAAGEGGEGD